MAFTNLTYALCPGWAVNTEPASPLHAVIATTPAIVKPTLDLIIFFAKPQQSKLDGSESSSNDETHPTRARNSSPDWRVDGIGRIFRVRAAPNEPASRGEVQHRPNAECDHD